MGRNIFEIFLIRLIFGISGEFVGLITKEAELVNVNDDSTQKANSK